MHTHRVREREYPTLLRQSMPRTRQTNRQLPCPLNRTSRSNLWGFLYWKIIRLAVRKPYTKTSSVIQVKATQGKERFELTEHALRFLLSTFIPIPRCPVTPTQITFPLPRTLIPVLIFSVIDDDGSPSASVSAPSVAGLSLGIESRRPVRCKAVIMDVTMSVTLEWRWY